ncbi:DUF402 domain-containing protein [Paenibacillus alkaliterrae]|uniref:DUF402 domain-containing protein n=1 Tax=Paenibacillus alkaliterrae TaxID=320909 RepID=UPI001F2E9607|nr:DUF402 domain-containing protein [Paenibacillus alkaliterrae]MCF2941143.1 DUF402 domain-containing protein [Paenibacillus alkaliterrae]
MEHYRHCVIKSFKHNGHLHRTWQQNWLVPDELLTPEHRAESMTVLINRQTPIQESDGKIWISRVPAVSFFIPGQWFNVVALLEEGGVRYYCNVASPPYLQGDVLTYIDYDLDVIRTADGERFVVDQDEYDMHKAAYHYPKMVDEKVREGLDALLLRIDQEQAPFHEQVVTQYFEEWFKQIDEVNE